MTEFDPIRAAADIDADWLTAVLHAAGIGIGNSLSVNRSGSIGTGQVGDNVRFQLEWSDPDPLLPQTVIGKFPSQSRSAGRAPGAPSFIDSIGLDRHRPGRDNVRFQLEWSDPDPSLPQTVIGKFPSQSEISRATAIAVETYVREIGFYRDLQHQVEIRTPHVLHVGWDPETHDFVVMMEDIAPAEPGDQLAGCDLPHAELVIDQAVGLHAPTWGRTEHYADFEWLHRPDAERAANLAGDVLALHPRVRRPLSGPPER